MKMLVLEENPAAFVGQLTDQPIRLERIAKPGLGPALVDAVLHGACIDPLSFAIEQGQFAARLLQPALEPSELDRTRLTGPGINVSRVSVGLIRHHGEPPSPEDDTGGL
jgi:hypothetical protein